MKQPPAPAKPKPRPGAKAKSQLARHGRQQAGAKAKAQPKTQKAVSTETHKTAVAAARKAARTRAANAKAAAAKAKTEHGMSLAGVPCCSARALAASLAIATGVHATAAEVLELHWRAGGGRARGVPLADALAAAGDGLAGWRPAAGALPVAGWDLWDGMEPHAAALWGGLAVSWGRLAVPPAPPDEVYLLGWQPLR